MARGTLSFEGHKQRPQTGRGRRAGHPALGRKGETGTGAGLPAALRLCSHPFRPRDPRSPVPTSQGLPLRELRPARCSAPIWAPSPHSQLARASWPRTASRDVKIEASVSEFPPKQHIPVS